MNKIEEIKKLVSLKNDGAITLEEFNILKEKIISSDENQNHHFKESVNSKNNSTTRGYKPEHIISNTNNNAPNNINNPPNKSLIYISIAIIVIIVFSIISLNKSDSFENTESNSRNILSEKPCHYCKGTGTEVCFSCGGTGVNNLGNECLCVRTYKQAIELGQSPPLYVLSWTCTHCKGTGLASN